MSNIIDFQGLINWCTLPHPNDKPRLKRVAACQLQRWLSNPLDGGIMDGEWTNGSLIYDAEHVRQIQGVFRGVVPSAMNPGHTADIAFTVAETDVWIGIKGDFIGSEWAEDVHVSEYAVSADGIGLSLIFRIPGNESHFDLSLSPTYLYGG